MPEQEPKKTTTIYARVPEGFKTEFKQALKAVGFSEAFFVRAVAEALIVQTERKDDFALPLRLLTVQQKRFKKK